MRGGAPSRLAALAGLALLASGCVGAAAGYQDVRQLTAARIQRDVRWYAHDAAAPAAKQTRELLARPLDADAAVQVALLNNAGLQAAFEELGVARAELVAALRVPNPTLDAELRFHTRQSTRPEIALQGLLSLSDLAWLPLRGAVGRARLEAAKLDVAGRVLDLALQTRVAFYLYQSAAQTLELRRSVLDALRASFEAAQQLHDAGNVTTLSFANERALYEEARVAFTRAEAMRLARREELAALMGSWGRTDTWTAAARLPDPDGQGPDLGRLETTAIERSLDLALARRRFEAAAQAANLATAEGWVPELRAGVAVEREHDDDFGWTVGPAVALELPLFYQGQGEAGVARAELRRAQQEHTNTAVQIRASARAIAAELEATARSAEYYRAVLLPLRQQIVDETQLQYNAMSTGVFQLLQAKRDQIEAARTYVELLRDYWTLRARADQLLAGRLPAPMPPSAAGDDSSLEGPRGTQSH